MSWLFSRRQESPEPRPGEQAELRRLREELQGLRDSLNQIATRAEMTAPPFVFAPLGPASPDELASRAAALRAEFGADAVVALRKKWRWSEAFLLEYEEARATGSPERMTKLKRAIQCEQTHTPFQKLLLEAYQQEFRDRYADAIAAFRDRFERCDLLVMHLTCRPRGHTAAKSAATFRDGAGRIGNVIVMGHGDAKAGDYAFNATNDLLIVPANDAYEGLADKSAAAYAFFAFAGLTAPVLKVDDDMRCADVARLLDELVPMARDRDYIGRVWHSRYGFARFWHMGKCSDPALNEKPYGLLTNASYAEGPAYFLGPRALHALGKAALYLEELFETEHGLEDHAMGKVLNHYGIAPVNYDPIAAGVVASTDAWMMERAGLPPLPPE